MKRVLSLVFSMGLAVTSAGCGCGCGEDQNCGAIGGELIMPRALLDLNVSKIQVIALDNGSGRNVGRLLSTCQKSNLGSEFQKDDMVEIHDGGDKKDALVVDVTLHLRNFGHRRERRAQAARQWKLGLREGFQGIGQQVLLGQPGGQGNRARLRSALQLSDPRLLLAGQAPAQRPPSTREASPKARRVR